MLNILYLKIFRFFYNSFSVWKWDFLEVKDRNNIYNDFFFGGFKVFFRVESISYLLM